MFDIAWVGLPSAIIGLDYILLVGRYWLPDRIPAAALFENPKEYTVEMEVKDDGPLVGKTVEEAGLRQLDNLYLVEIERDARLVPEVGPNERLKAGDRVDYPFGLAIQVMINKSKSAPVFEFGNKYAILKNVVLPWINNASPQLIIILCLVLVGLVGAADYLTGYEISFSIFYLIPISIVSWYVGKGAGLAISFLSAIVWLNMDLMAGHQYTHGAIPFWNTGVRLGFYALTVHLLAQIRSHLDLEKSLARIDTLTGTLNRRAFEQEGQRLLSLASRNGYPITLAYLDVDNFKFVNDTWGHSEGDRLLRVIGETLSHSVRSHDFVARLGGDEFALLLPATDRKGAGPVIQRIWNHLSEMITYHKWPITFSIGVVTFQKPSPITINQAINAADRLMYRAKKSGKNNILYQMDTA